jgi:hypothetical protein
MYLLVSCYSVGFVTKHVFGCNNSSSCAHVFCICTNIVDCGSLPDPAFGKVEYTSTVYGSEAVYKCNIGYSLQGLTTRKCEADRNWSGVTPTCTIIGEYSSYQVYVFYQ